MPYEISSLSKQRRSLIRIVPALLAASLVVLLCSLASASPSNAASIEILSPADPVEDSYFNVSASGVGPYDFISAVTIKPAGGTGCASNWQDDTGTNVIAEDINGSFTFTDRAYQSDEGQYLLCGWVQEYAGSTIAVARTSRTITVRAAKASLTISASPLPTGQVSTLKVSGNSEFQRGLYLTIKRAGGAGCATSYRSDVGRDVDAFDVEGSFSDRSVSLGDLEPGSYLVCGWIQESNDDMRPEATQTVEFTVSGGGSSECLDAQQREKTLKSTMLRLKRTWLNSRRAKRAKARKNYVRAKRQFESARSSREAVC